MMTIYSMVWIVGFGKIMTYLCDIIDKMAITSHWERVQVRVEVVENIK